MESLSKSPSKTNEELEEIYLKDLSKDQIVVLIKEKIKELFI